MDAKEQSMGDLLNEWEELRAQGHVLSVEEFCQQYPSVDAAELARRIRQIQALDRLLNLDEEATDTPMPVPTLPGYIIEKEVGRGGMGVVYTAHETTLNRRVALKVLPTLGLAGAPDAQLREKRFEREAQALARLRHPNIVQIHAAQLREGQSFFVMEYVEGGSLADQIESWTKGNTGKVAVLMAKVARAVDYAHRKQIIHRDLKPGNILIDADGEPRVVDFGLAKLKSSLDESKGEETNPANAEAETKETRRSALTLPGVEPGTPPYMAPEQFDSAQFGSVSPTTDVWALGVILYELLTGQRPFDGKDWQTVRPQVCRATPTKPRKLRPGLDARLETIVLRCLEKQPSKRYASAGAVAEALTATQRSRWKWVGLTAVILLGAVTFVWLSMLPSQQKASSPELKPSPEEEYRTAVQPLLASLARGEAVDLVPSGKPPVAYFPRVGGDALQIKKDSKSGLLVYFHSHYGFLELLPEVPCERFVVRVEMLHINTYTPESRVGIYFAYSQHNTATGTFYCFNLLGLNDPRDPPGVKIASEDERNRLHVHQYAIYDSDNGFPTFKSKVLNPLHFPEAARGKWHTIVAQIQPHRIEVTCDGKSLGAFHHIKSADIVRKRAPLKLIGREEDIKLPLKGGLGMMIRGGAIAVRWLSVEPLP